MSKIKPGYYVSTKVGVALFESIDRQIQIHNAEVEEVTYMFQLVSPSKAYYDRLVVLKEQFPALTFSNRGYENLSNKVKEAHKAPIEEITIILRDSLKGFSRFQNFINRKDGSWSIRLQYEWDASFTGVGYFDSRHWNPEDHGKY